VSDINKLYDIFLGLELIVKELETKKMQYNKDNPINYYTIFSEKEWFRLERNRLGELIYHVHNDILNNYIKNSDYVLELGAGAGRYTKDLVNMCNKLIVSDITPKQLELNKNKMKEFNVFHKIEDFIQLDITDLSNFQNDLFDVTLCIGGPLNYVMDGEEIAINELIRVTKKNGIIILGVMSLISATIRFLGGIAEEKKKYGIEATKYVMNTGIQDETHYPVENKHFIHMMKKNDLDLLLNDRNIEIIEKRGAGIFAASGEEALNKAKCDNELWSLILEKEIEYSKNENIIELGANIVYII
jgi:ubiquinone/menaquinone biosynthesis C-methylase UbiE